MKARIIGSVLIGACVFGITAAQASAGTNLTPASADFGSQTVGTTSPPQAFTLSLFCSSEDAIFPGLCAFAEFAAPNVSTTGDFAQTNTCPPILIVASYPETQFCTINVTFNPSATGARAGTLTAGSMERPLSGSGLAAPVATATPPATQPITPFNLKAAISRCKEKFPKGPRRKKCIKRAKKRAL